MHAWKRLEWVETSHAIDCFCDFLINVHYYTIYGHNIDGCKKVVQFELVTEYSQHPCGLMIVTALASVCRWVFWFVIGYPKYCFCDWNLHFLLRLVLQTLYLVDCVERNMCPLLWWVDIMVMYSFISILTQDLFPAARRKRDVFDAHFREAGLDDLIKFHQAQQNMALKRRIKSRIGKLP